MKFWGYVVYHMSVIRTSWNGLSANRIIMLSQRTVLLLSLLSIILLVFMCQRLPPEVPLWYSRPWGENQLAHPLWLFLLPLGSVFWFMVSLLCSVYLTKDHLTFTQILFLSTVVTSMLSCITLVQIVFLIT